MMAFKQSNILGKDVQNGKQAIKSEHKKRLIESAQNRVLHSLDFDLCSTQAGLSPHLKRWDYFLEISGLNQKTVAVEVHPFKTSELRDKKRDTVDLLKKHCPNAVQEIHSWHALITGEIRTDLIKHFQADSGIKIHRNIELSKI